MNIRYPIYEGVYRILTQKRILWLFVRGFTFRTKIVRELCSVQYIDIQYITIILIIRSYGCTKIPPLFFKGCCNGLHDSFGSQSIFSRLFFDYLNLNHYFCINT